MSAIASPPGFLLVRPKLHVPEFRSGLVSRRKLVWLCAESERKLVLVCAPAGLGKTVLLSDWHAAEEARAFAWVSLDRGDDDPVRFWSYLVGALRTVEPGLGAAALTALPTAGHALADVVVAPLISTWPRSRAGSSWCWTTITSCARRRCTPRWPSCCGACRGRSR